MTAPAGAIVGIYIDNPDPVHRLDIIETSTGRRYQVIAVRVQTRGLHAGRQHLRCLVLAPGDDVGKATRVHRLAWYRR